MTTDPIADMLTRIRNGLERRNDTVVFPYSNIKAGILDVLKAKRLIENYEVKDESSKKNIQVTLKYVSGKPAIYELKRISKPGKRVYTDYRNIPVIKNNYGFVILSTSRGIKDTYAARKEKIGGEIMCEVL